MWRGSLVWGRTSAGTTPAVAGTCGVSLLFKVPIAIIIVKNIHKHKVSSSQDGCFLMLSLTSSNFSLSLRSAFLYKRGFGRAAIAVSKLDN